MRGARVGDSEASEQAELRMLLQRVVEILAKKELEAKPKRVKREVIDLT